MKKSKTKFTTKELHEIERLKETINARGVTTMDKQIAEAKLDNLVKSKEFNKRPERVAAGLKAVVHNNNMSQEARNRAAERLRNMGVDPDEKFSAKKATQETTATEGPTRRPTGAASRPVLRSQIEDSTEVLDSVEIHEHILENPFMSPEAEVRVEEFLETHIHED
ncbi:hypothetical protein BJ912DRAFT_1143934 [Pholiota molesta]|nr:hypothetical protein BJ912DRAFT_1143934 [Pholiota molesta]